MGKLKDESKQNGIEWVLDALVHLERAVGSMESHLDDFPYDDETKENLRIASKAERILESITEVQEQGTHFRLAYYTRDPKLRADFLEMRKEYDDIIPFDVPLIDV